MTQLQYLGSFTLAAFILFGIYKIKFFEPVLIKTDSWFYISRIRENLERTQRRIAKNLLFNARFTRGFYFYMVINFLLNVLISGQFTRLINVLLVALLFPFIYRIVMGMQMHINKI